MIRRNRIVIDVANGLTVWGWGFWESGDRMAAEPCPCPGDYVSPGVCLDLDTSRRSDYFQLEDRQTVSVQMRWGGEPCVPSRNPPYRNSRDIPQEHASRHSSG